MITVTDEPECKYLISAGQLGMFLPYKDKGCPRKWALHYPGEVPKKSGPALEFGIKSHACLEEMHSDTWPQSWPTHWTGQEATEEERERAKIAVLSLEMWNWKPKGSAVVEPTYFLNVPDLDDGGTSFYIKPDLWVERKSFVDWKTTSAQVSHSPWVLHAESDGPILPEDVPFKPLSKDIQGNLYAYGLMIKARERKQHARWVYGCKKFRPGTRPRTWNVDYTFTRYGAQAFFDDTIRPAALLMNGIRRGIESGAIDSPLLIPHVGESCEYSGRFCDALNHCGLAESPITLSSLSLPVIQ
jgi:hypothetical protein